MKRQEDAETLGLRALAWLAGNDDLLPVFLGSTGFSGAELMQRAAEPEFLASVLDFILMDDAWVVACCDAIGVAYPMLGQARMLLPGGAQIHWT